MSNHVRTIFLVLLTAAIGTSAAGCVSSDVSGAVERPHMVSASWDEQRRFAVHEMAHAVAWAALIGAQHVSAIHVHSMRCRFQDYVSEHCCDLVEYPHYGSVNAERGWWQSVNLSEMSVTYRKVVMYLAGPAADQVLNGVDPSDSYGRDIRNAMNQLATDDGDSEEMRQAWEHARALVYANRFVIGELADHLLLRRPDHYGRHIMTGGLFRRLLKDYVLIDPLSWRLQ